MKNPPAIKTSSENENVFMAVVWFIWLAVAGFTIFHHEMWRDELQAWMLVKSSPSYQSLLQNIRYEGHPLLWFSLLWIWKFFSAEPEAIQVLHFTIAAASAFVFLRFAPFSRWQRALFIFGYFPLYEYAAISRNYAVGILLLFVFLVVFQRLRQKYLLLAIVLFLLMQANFFTLLLAVVLGFGLCFEVFRNRKTHMIKPQKMLLPAGIFLAGIFLSVYCIFPPQDHFFGGEWRQQFSLSNLGGIMTIVWRSSVPLPNPEIHFWNTNFISNLWLQFGLSLALIVSGFSLFYRKRWVLMIFVTGLCLMLMFFYMRMFGSLRHQGHIYLLFVTCLWLMNMDKSDKNDAENQIQYLIFPKSALVTLIFTVQVVAAAWACFTDWKFPFSAAKQTAELIEGSELRSMPVVGDADMIVSTVSGYLQKPVYYLLTEKNGDYITWNKERDKSLHEKELINRATKYSSLQKQDILLILTYELKENHPQIQFIKSFTQSIEPSEIYYLYTLKYE